MKRRRAPVRKRGYKRAVWAVPVECYSRVVGYLRPVQNWNKGKCQEWLDRVMYDMPEAVGR